MEARLPQTGAIWPADVLKVRIMAAKHPARPISGPLRPDSRSFPPASRTPTAIRTRMCWQRLNEHDAPVFRTDRDGLITIRSDGPAICRCGPWQTPAGLYGAF